MGIHFVRIVALICTSLSNSAYGKVTGSINGVMYPNNSLVDIADIGLDEEAFKCLTTYNHCCRMSDDIYNQSHGIWFFPDGRAIGSRSGASASIFSRSRDHRAILLHRGINASSPTGIFTCRIPDSHRKDKQKLYFGIYGETEGLPTISELIYDINSGTVRCISTGGPATTVEWSKTGPSFKQTKILLDTTNATYCNSISIVSSNTSDYSGIFRCSITNGRGTTSKSIGPFQDVAIVGKYSYIPGSSAKVTCFSNLTVLSMQWIYTNGSDEVFIVGNTGENNELTINIDNVSISHSFSSYTCKINISLPNGNVRLIQRNYSIIIQEQISETSFKANEATTGDESYSLTVFVISTGTTAAFLALITIVFVLAFILRRCLRKDSSTLKRVGTRECEPHIYEVVNDSKQEVEDDYIEVPKYEVMNPIC